MPAVNPRISVTVAPSVEAVLARLSLLTGQSKSSFIAEILESSLPVFERLVTVIEAAKQAKDSLKAKTVRDMEEAEGRLHDLLGVTMDIFDQASKPILEEAERVHRRAATTVRTDGRTRASAPPARPKPAALPPYVTRGSGTSIPGKGAIAGKAEKTAERSDGIATTAKKSPAKGSKRVVAPSKSKVKG